MHTPGSMLRTGVCCAGWHLEQVDSKPVMAKPIHMCCTETVLRALSQDSYICPTHNIAPHDGGRADPVLVLVAEVLLPPLLPDEKYFSRLFCLC